jgi:hypothetical protein
MESKNHTRNQDKKNPRKALSEKRGRRHGDVFDGASPGRSTSGRCGCCDAAVSSFLALWQLPGHVVRASVFDVLRHLPSMALQEGGGRKGGCSFDRVSIWETRRGTFGEGRDPVGPFGAHWGPPGDIWFHWATVGASGDH